MEILVCIKQVPESNKVEVNPVTGVLNRSSAASKMNPYDLYALETALRLRQELGGRVKGAREQLSFRLGREPTIEEIAGELGVSREEVAASLEAGAQVESLYQTPGRDGEGGSCLLDRMEDMGRSGEQEQLLNRMVLEELIGQLEEKEKEIIVRRYFENQTQTQVAQALGVSQVQISRLEKKILKQMRARL